MNPIIRGSCLCGGVRFEVRPPFIRAGHRHCSRAPWDRITDGLAQFEGAWEDRSASTFTAGA